MKHLPGLILPLLLSISLFFACSKAEENTADTSQPAAKMQTVALKVDGMSCQGCANSIETALAGVDGVADKSVSFDDKKASITFDPKRTDVDDLTKVIEEAGYTVKLN